MYNEHFGIINDPFKRSSSADVFYPGKNQVKVCDEILDAVRRRAGLIVLTGARGAGKSLMLMRIIANLDAYTHAIRVQDENDIQQVFNTLYDYFKRRRLADFRVTTGDGAADDSASIQHLSRFKDNLRRIEVNELVQFVKHNLDDIQIDRVRRLQVLRKSLEGGLRHGRNAVLFIDNVEHIDPEDLRELVQLSTARYSYEKLLQVVIGASDRQALELVPKFKSSIALIRRVKPLDAVEVELYLSHLLRLSGLEGESPITSPAIQRLIFYSKRIPGRINALCSAAIAIAEQDSIYSINSDLIDRAAAIANRVQARPGRSLAKVEKRSSASNDSRRSRPEEKRTALFRPTLVSRLKSLWNSEPSPGVDKNQSYSSAGLSTRFAAHLPFVDTNGDTREPRQKAVKAQFDIGAALLDQRLKTLLFTATHNGAGNTTCASALAQVLRRFTEHKVLIIDGNRSGFSLSQKFGMENQPGLFNLIYNGGGMDVVRYVQPAPGADFDLLTYGYDFPTDWPFLRDRFEQVLQSLSEQYRYVIYDAPPIPASPNLYTIASLFDGVALVVQAEKSRWESSQAVVSQLRQSGANILGVVMNRRKYYIPEWLYKNL